MIDVNSTLQFNVVYEKIITDYTVEHYKEDLAGGTYTLADTETVENVEAGSAATFTPKTTYTGYNYAAAKTEYKDTDNTTASTTELTVAPDGSLVVMLYYDAQDFTVTYNGNGSDGGTVPTDAATYNYGATVTVKTDLPTKTGATFVCWKFNPEFQPGDSFTINDTYLNAALTDLAGTKIITLTAQWSYEASYSFVSGTAGQDLPAEVTALLPALEKGKVDGSSVTPANPAKTSVAAEGGFWNFTGWDAANKTVSGAPVEFVGTWTFGTTQAPPKTGDNSSIALYGALLAISAAALVWMFFLKKKKKED